VLKIEEYKVLCALGKWIFEACGGLKFRFDLHEAVIFAGPLDSAGRACFDLSGTGSDSSTRHSPLASTFVATVFPESATFTFLLGLAQPQTLITLSCCNTMLALKRMGMRTSAKAEVARNDSNMV
jgi:hypothetical protein